MRRPGKAVDTAMLAAAIGIDRAVEAHIGGFIPGDGAAGRIDGDGSGERGQILILAAIDRAPAIILARAIAGLEAPDGGRSVFAVTVLPFAFAKTSRRAAVERADSRPPLRMAALPDLSARAAICGTISGRASKIMPMTPIGHDSL